MADRRIWPTNNIVDLAQVADAFGLPDNLLNVETATRSVGETLEEILVELKRIRLGIALLVDEDLEELG